MKDSINVAVGVLFDDEGKIIISQRQEGKPSGGLWEFPGGKQEYGEKIEETLSRELFEELGIKIIKYRPLISLISTENESKLTLNVFLINSWTGDIDGREGQKINSVLIPDLEKFPMPKSNQFILKALALPDRFLITPPNVDDRTQFINNLEKTFKQGISLFQLRVFGLEESSHLDLINEIQQISHDKNVKMLLNGSFDLLEKTDLSSIHLSSSQLSILKNRPMGIDFISASCHNINDLENAEKIDVDFAVLSPVLPTKSHPDAEPLGWENFERLSSEVNFPIFALGGMREEHLKKSWKYGAQGIAGIRGFWPENI